MMTMVSVWILFFNKKNVSLNQIPLLISNILYSHANGNYAHVLIVIISNWHFKIFLLLEVKSQDQELSMT